jgi:AP-3 complex subunit beta
VSFAPRICIPYNLTTASLEIIVTQSVLVLRSLLTSRDFSAGGSVSISRPSIINRLIDLLEEGKIESPVARANVYYLVGQFANEGLLESGAPDVVRLGAKGFAQEVICSAIIHHSAYTS